MRLRFEYGTVRVRDLRAFVSSTSKRSLPAVDHIEVNDERLRPTPRFWRSFFGRYHISDNVFRYFSHAEVFERISMQSKNEQFRYCIERKKGKPGRLLGISGIERPLLSHGEVESLVKSYGGSDVRYDNGLVISTHMPTTGEHVVKIGNDRFQNRYVLETPVDGFGTPKIHLSLLRMICTNGAVGYSRAFRTEISMGKNPAYSISRALGNYDNDNGYAALWQRFESAQASWASLRETQELYTLLITLESLREFTEGGIVRSFYEVTGRPHELYGVANLDAISVKRQRVLPAKCRVYDLLNFASEVATHKAQPHAALMLQAYIGRLVSDEYDMEGTADKVTDFRDFFLNSSTSQVSRN